MNLLSLLWQHVAFENSAWQLVFWSKLGLELLMVRKLLMSLTEWTFFTSWIVVVPFIIKLWCILPCALTSHKRNQTFCYHGRRKRSIGTMFWGKAILWLVNVLAKHGLLIHRTCTQVMYQKKNLHSSCSTYLPEFDAAIQILFYFACTNVNIVVPFRLCPWR